MSGIETSVVALPSTVGVVVVGAVDSAVAAGLSPLQADVDSIITDVDDIVGKSNDIGSVRTHWVYRIRNMA